MKTHHFSIISFGKPWGFQCFHSCTGGFLCGAALRAAGGWWGGVGAPGRSFCHVPGGDRTYNDKYIHMTHTHMYIYIHIIDAKMATGSIFFEFQLLLHDSRKSMCVAITPELRVVTLLVIGQPRSLVSSVWGMAYSFCSR